MRPPDHTPAVSDARGYAMAVLLVALAVMLTLMSMAMPVWKQQAKREKEEELLFRLKQYAHALALYQRRLPGASPANLDDLVKERYLRKKYKDPMTGKDFAILRVGQVSPGMTATLPADGPGGRAGQTRPEASPGGAGRPMTPTGSGFGGTASSPGQVLQPGLGGAGGTVGGIRGVVSTSKDTSLRAWKGRTQYDQWEVAIEDITPRFFGVQSPQPGQSQRPGGPGGQARPGGPSGPGALPSNPYGTTIRRQ